MKIAVLADIHLPSGSSIKEIVWQWALDTARTADLIVGIGDLTALGEVAAARRIMDDLTRCGTPFILTPGNAELRTPDESAELLRIMATPTRFGKAVILDSARGKLTADASAVLQAVVSGSDRGVIIFTHCPVTHWSPEDQQLLDDGFSNGSVAKVVHGHSHCDICDAAVEGVRGLDPDKASGGAPALVFYTENPDGVWQREDLVCPLAHVAEFPAEDKRKLASSIGISGMKDPLAALQLAIEKRLPVFEIRFREPETFPDAALVAAVEQWRACGGKYLSLHLPDLKYADGEFSGQDMLAQACEAAVKLHCDGVTFHVPRCFADELATGEAISRAAAVAGKALQPLFANGISVGVENLHTTAAEREAKRYKFGCTPPECMAFINALRAQNPGARIGLHLDIGHARNNIPFCSRYTVSDWYAGCGSEIVAMHIHQVQQVKGAENKNHVGFTHFYGKLISLSSLCMARKYGQIGSDVPMILELRCPAEESLDVLAAELR